jgi:hypothetical protein
MEEAQEGASAVETYSNFEVEYYIIKITIVGFLVCGPVQWSSFFFSRVADPHSFHPDPDPAF